MNFEEDTIPLDQRGRAGLQFLGSLQVYTSRELLEDARQQFAHQPEAERLALEFQASGGVGEWRQRLDQARQVAERSVEYRFNRFYERYVAEENWVRGLTAVERKRDQFAGRQRAVPITERLILDPDLAVPDYHDGVEWHLQPGGWEGYDLAAPCGRQLSCPTSIAGEETRPSR